MPVKNYVLDSYAVLIYFQDEVQDKQRKFHPH